jgi:hypothetical protein
MFHPIPFSGVTGEQTPQFFTTLLCNPVLCVCVLLRVCVEEASQKSALVP